LLVRALASVEVDFDFR